MNTIIHLQGGGQVQVSADAARVAQLMAGTGPFIEFKTPDVTTFVVKHAVTHWETYAAGG